MKSTARQRNSVAAHVGTFASIPLDISQSGISPCRPPWVNAMTSVELMQPQFDQAQTITLADYYGRQFATVEARTAIARAG